MKQIISRMILVFVTILLIMETVGKMGTVYAAEETAFSYIYHSHVGSSKAEGGCYGEPVFHQHTGDEMTGGSCYGTPIYHTHEGDEVSGGGCYGAVRYHEHQGDGTTEEGCYRAVYHEHTQGCYRKVPYDEDGCHIEEAWDTADGDYEGHDYMWYQMSCGELIHGTSAWHQHDVLNCNRGNELAGYALSCGKTSETVEGYALSCAKTSETVEKYQLSCNKNSETIDSYRRNCGKEEHTPCGKIVIKKTNTGNGEVTLLASIEDLSGGTLQIQETPFVWYNSQGEIIGTGSRLTVFENGTYKLKAGIKNEDIRAESLWTTVNVSSVNKQDSSALSGTENQKGQAESTTASVTTTVRQPVITAIATTTPNATTMPTATTMPIVTTTPKVTAAPKSIVRPKATATPSLLSLPDSVNNQSAIKETSAEDKNSPTPKFYFKKDTTVVKNEEKKSNVEPVIIPEQLTQEEQKESPVIRLLLVTFGTLIVSTGIFLVGYFFRQSVSVYNDDGEGTLIYLGRVIVQLTEEGYLVSINEQMEEKAYTNRYCIKAGLFGIGKGNEEELLVEKQDKCIRVPLQKEMIVII